MKRTIKIIVIVLIIAAVVFGILSFIRKQKAMMAQYQAMMEMQNAPKPVTVEKPSTKTVTEYYGSDFFFQVEL